MLSAFDPELAQIFSSSLLQDTHLDMLESGESRYSLERTPFGDTGSPYWSPTMLPNIDPLKLTKIRGKGTLYGRRVIGGTLATVSGLVPRQARLRFRGDFGLGSWHQRRIKDVSWIIHLPKRSFLILE